MGKLPVLGRPTNLDNTVYVVGQGATALGVGADGDGLDIFSHFFLPLSGKRPNIDYNTVLKQPTNQPLKVTCWYPLREE